MSKENEIIDIVDNNDMVIGKTNVQEAHTESILHRVVGVILLTQGGEMVVQTGNKFAKYDIAAGGHVGTGEDPSIAAARELEEELGVIVPLKKISAFVPKEARHSHLWHVFEGIVPEDWRFKPTDEVSSVMTMKMEEIITGMNKEPESWTFGFQNVMREYLRIKRISISID